MSVAPISSAAIAAVRPWAVDFGRYDDDQSQLAIALAAGRLAGQLRAGDVAQVTFEPGNSTRYVVVVTRITPVLGCSIGGQMIVSLPINGGRRCAAISLDLPGEWTPSWVTETFDLLPGDGLLIASVLTLVTAQLTR